VVATATIATTSNINLVDGKTVEVRWASVQETLIKEYSCQTKLSSATTWNQFDLETPMGAGTSYVAKNVPSVTGTYDYRLVARFTDATQEKVLLTQSIPVTVQNGTAEVSNFAAVYNANVGSIDVSWSSVKEVALVDYVVQAKLITEPDTAYADMQPPVDPVGEGQPYLSQVFLDTIDYNVRLKAVFQDGSNAIVLNTTVEVQVPITA